MKKGIIVIIIILFIWKCGCSNNDAVATSSYAKGDKWYEGGTLHKAKISDWKSASEKNKLATCADFVYSVNKNLSLIEVKNGANELKVCINEAVKDHDVADQSEVSEIATLCLILLNN